jgi:hypothetical protein
MRSIEFSIHLFDSEPETRQKQARNFGTSPPTTRTSARPSRNALAWTKVARRRGKNVPCLVSDQRSQFARSPPVTLEHLSPFKVALEFGSVFAPARLWAAQSKLDGTLDSGSALANARFGGTVCSVFSHCRIGIRAIVGLRFVLDQRVLMSNLAAQSAGLFLCQVGIRVHLGCDWVWISARARQVQHRKFA